MACLDDAHRLMVAKSIKPEQGMRSRLLFDD
jgi:hypothetical protein